MKKVFALLFAFALLTILAAAGMKPDFSGTWVLNKTKSKLQVERFSAMDRGVAVIRHEEPHFKFTRTFTYGGKDDTISFDLLTDGKAVAGEEEGMKTLSTMNWDGDVLVFVTRYILPDREATNTVRYTLLDGGKTQADEKFRGPRLKYDNLWIFDRK